MARTNADPITTALQQKEWNSIVSALDSIGDADQLYYAVREVSPSEPQTLSFSSLEHRPPLIISGIKDQPKVYNTFGLDLHLAFPPVEQGNFGTTVSWKGNYSWSTNFLSKSKLQRFAAILHKIGSLTGAGFSDDRGKKGRPRGGGGIVLFKAKEIKAKEAGLPEKPEDRADYKLHYYGAPRGFSSLAGNAHLVPGVFYSELIRQEGSSFECFLLLIRYQEFE